jgi:hypothetical protein
MTEITLSGGPLDGEKVEIETGQAEITKDGCVYRHRDCDGVYRYVSGTLAEKPTPRTRRKMKDIMPEVEG